MSFLFIAVSVFMLVSVAGSMSRQLDRWRERPPGFCEDLPAKEHTALRPGAALPLPEDDDSVRCAYVDYDGDAALARWRRRPPTTTGEENAFVMDVFPLLTGGVASIGRYLEAVRGGGEPAHSDEPPVCSIESLGEGLR